jgi:hypothetical protein
MGKINNHKNVINELVMKTKEFSNKQKLKKVSQVNIDMPKNIEIFVIVWKNNLDQIITDNEYAFDEKHALSKIKSSAGFDSILFIDKYPLSLKSMKIKEQLTGVKPS